MKGLIFYFDAILALILTIVIISGIGIYYTIEPELKYRTIQAEAEDMMQLMSQKVNVTETGLPENYTDKTFLEVIGTLWLNENYTEATNLANYTLSKFDMRCIELVFEGEAVYKNKPECNEENQNVVVANRVASGYISEKKPEGYMARVIPNKMRRIAPKYNYFGGYVGDGNITTRMNINFMEDVIDAKMEVDAGSNFSLYINGLYSGTYSPTEVNMSSDVFVICNETYQSSYCDNFEENNTLKFIFLGNRSYFGGGYVKVRYNTTEFEPEDPFERLDFPGIEGVINLYSSFYIPGILQGMNAFIHYTSNYTIFLNIGNVTVYTGSTPEDEEISVIINSSEISSALSSGGLSYSGLSNRTVPLRLGMQNVSYLTVGYDAADVFSVTDLSGSMDDNCGNCDGLTCSQSSCNDSNGCKICDAKSANYVLIDAILNESVNRVGLVGYETLAKDSDFHHLTNETQPLKNVINYTWDADGYTCICCGINKAVENLFYLPIRGDNRLVVYVQFENNLTDMSGSGNNGQSSGGPTYVLGGVKGRALQFDGNNDFVYINDNEGLSGSPRKNLTVAAWINWTNTTVVGGTTSDPVPVVTKYRDSYNKDWGLGIVGRKVYFGAESNGNNWDSTGLIGTTNITTGQWHHVAFTLEGRNVKIYLDGKLNGSTTLNFDTPDTDDNVEIGRNDYGRDYFKGRIDEVRIYNQVLNQTEIEALATTTSSCGNNLTEAGEICDGSFKVCESGGNKGKRVCGSQCTFGTCDTTGVCSDGIKNQGEECDDGNENNSDGCSSLCKNEKNWYRSLIVMSDGGANVECTPYNVCNIWDSACIQRAKDDAVQAACDAQNNFGVFIHSVGFGDDVDETTLQNIADCGQGEYYFSNTTELEDIYRMIAANILNASYKAQTVMVYEGDYGNITLYPDSYINFTYFPPANMLEYGEISVTLESPKFGGVVESPKNGTFVVPSETKILNAKITSYSSEYWTDRAFIYNGTSWNQIYRLWDYDNEYVNLGDPYLVYIPIDQIREDENNVSIDTAAREENTTGGSPDSSVIYDLGVNILTDYGGVFNKTEGSSKTVYYDMDLDGTNDGSVDIILGNESDPWDPEIDAIDNAMMKLLDKLNFYNDTGTDDGSEDNPIDVYPGDLSFDMVPIGGIPWLWGPGIFTLKVW